MGRLCLLKCNSRSKRINQRNNKYCSEDGENCCCRRLSFYYLLGRICKCRNPCFRRSRGYISGFFRRLKECGKFQNKNRNLVKSVKKIQNTGFEVNAGFILGFDSDKASIFQSQIEFIQKSGIVTAMVGLLNVSPKTRLYERLKKPID